MSLADHSEAEILAIANPIMDNLMNASTRIDYERHVRDFTERAKAALSRNAFEAICRHYQEEKGYFARREFVTIFRRPDSVAILWRQWFSKAPGEHVAEMVLIEREGRHLVDHVMVF
jgi:hypothetical protein